MIMFNYMTWNYVSPHRSARILHWERQRWTNTLWGFPGSIALRCHSLEWESMNWFGLIFTQPSVGASFNPALETISK
jgi:hypothetical protein